MVTRTLNTNTKSGKRHGTHSQTKRTTTRQDWPVDFAEAYQRDLGPYTVYNTISILEEEPVELFNGWLVWQPMTDAEERRVAANIQEILTSAARASNFGQAYPDQFDCIMVNGNVQKPDVCVISTKRYTEKVQPLEEGEDHPILKGSPEWVVEIRSPSNRRTQERQKREYYFESGTVVIWDVDPKKHKIWVYEATDPEKGQEYGEDAVITCEALIPGWKRKVSDFFSKDLSLEEMVGEPAKQWRAESEIITLQQVILLQAGIRFGSEVPSSLAERLSRCTREKLMELIGLLASTTDLIEWLEAVPE